MTFLELATRFWQLSGVTGTSSLTTVEGLTGEALGLVNMINDAWNDIQCMNDQWLWMRQSYVLGQQTGSTPIGCSFETVAGVYSYPLGTDPGQCGIDPETFGKWDPYAFRTFTTALTARQDETTLQIVDYDTWRDRYIISALRTVQTRPYVVAIGPDMSVCLGPPPNGNYTIEGDYWLKPSLMEEDDDVPVGLPSEYHMMIVYKALDTYAQGESVPELAGMAKKKYTPLSYKLTRAYGPTVQVGTL